MNESVSKQRMEEEREQQQQQQSTAPPNTHTHTQLTKGIIDREKEEKNVKINWSLMCSRASTSSLSSLSRSLIAHTLGSGTTSVATATRFAGIAAAFLIVGGRIRCPQGEIVSEQLHYQCAVLVRILVQRVEFGDRVVKRLLG